MLKPVSQEETVTNTEQPNQDNSTKLIQKIVITPTHQVNNTSLHLQHQAGKQNDTDIAPM